MRCLVRCLEEMFDEMLVRCLGVWAVGVELVGMLSFLQIRPYVTAGLP